MKTKYHRESKRNNEGVALIMVLGLLAILTMLSVAFAIAMRVERVAARNYANGVRAKHLIETGIARVMDDIGQTMAGEVYPCWDQETPNGMADPDMAVYDILPSRLDDINTLPMGDDLCGDLVSGEAFDSLPLILHDELEKATNYIAWKEIIGGDQKVKGRIAYVAVNLSGLLDANYAGGVDASQSMNITNLSQLKLSTIRNPKTMVPDLNDPDQFYKNRDDHIRYENTRELSAMNNAAGPKVVSDDIYALGTYSFDPDKDVWFRARSLLGRRDLADVALAKKMNFNSWTNWTAGGIYKDEFHVMGPDNLTTNAQAFVWEYEGRSGSSFKSRYLNGIADICKRIGLRNGNYYINYPVTADGNWRFWATNQHFKTETLDTLQDFFDPNPYPSKWGATTFSLEGGGDCSPGIEEFWIEQDPTVNVMVGNGTNTHSVPMYRYSVAFDLWYRKIPRVCKADEFDIVVTAQDHALDCWRDTRFQTLAEHPAGALAGYPGGSTRYKAETGRDATKIRERTRDAIWRWDLPLKEDMYWPEKQIQSLRTEPEYCTIDRVPTDPLNTNAGEKENGRWVPAGSDAAYALYPYFPIATKYQSSTPTTSTEFQDGVFDEYCAPAGGAVSSDDGLGYITFPYIVSVVNDVDTNNVTTNKVAGHVELARGDSTGIPASGTHSANFGTMTTVPDQMTNGVMLFNAVTYAGPDNAIGCPANQVTYIDLSYNQFPVRGKDFSSSYEILPNRREDWETKYNRLSFPKHNRMLWGYVWANPMVVWRTNYKGEEYKMLCSNWSTDGGTEMGFWPGVSWTPGFNDRAKFYKPTIPGYSPPNEKEFDKKKQNPAYWLPYGKIGISREVGSYEMQEHFHTAGKSIQLHRDNRPHMPNDTPGRTWKGGVHVLQKNEISHQIKTYYTQEGTPGLPIYVANGPLKSITEVAHIHFGNGGSGARLDYMVELVRLGKYLGGHNAIIRNGVLQLMHAMEGGGILDQVVVHDPAKPAKTHGVVSLSSGQFDCLRGMLDDIKINRNTNYSGITLWWDPEPAALDELANVLIDEGPFVSWYDVWGWDTNLFIGRDMAQKNGNYMWAFGEKENNWHNRVANAIRNVLFRSRGRSGYPPPGSGAPGRSKNKLGMYYKPEIDSYKDQIVTKNNGSDAYALNATPHHAIDMDMLGQLVNIVSFRNNYLSIIVAAQVFGKDEKTVVGEKRAIATVYRDGYSGKYFVRSFKWLAE